MPRATRRWRWTRAVGTALCLLLIAAYVYSLNHSLLWTSPSDRFWVYALRGLVGARYSRNIEERSGDPPRWEWPVDYGRVGEGPTVWGFGLEISSDQSSASIPLWFPFLVVALPTVYAWRRCRGVPRGHCTNCAYNLAGISAGVCPECGMALEPKGGAA